MLYKLSLAAPAVVLASWAFASGPAQASSVAEIATRPGQTIRFLLDMPAGTPAGSVILLAGGHGNLALEPNGQIGWGAGNQLVRTRARYAKAGFVTAVPDIAADLKQGRGGVPKYRWSQAHAADIGALIKHLRRMAGPVYLVGTSRAALSVANAAVRLAGVEAPDAIVITSGMLMDVAAVQPSVQKTVGRLGRIEQATFIVHHVDDQCPYTLASSAARFKPLLTRARKVDILILRGGTAGSGDPCEARSPHGFAGMDGEVVRAVATWLKAL